MALPYLARVHGYVNSIHRAGLSDRHEPGCDIRQRIEGRARFFANWPEGLGAARQEVISLTL
jgi:hypothetical protein